MTVHHSTYPDITLPVPSSIFHYHFPTTDLRKADSQSTLPGSKSKSSNGGTVDYADELVGFVDALTGAAYTRGDAKRLSLRLGLGLERHFGLFPSARRAPRVILIFSPNTRHYPIIFFGCQSVLYITSPANAGYTASELAHQIRDSGAEGAFVHPDLIEAYSGALDALSGEKTANSIESCVLRRNTWLALPDKEVTDAQRKVMTALKGSFRGFDSVMVPDSEVGSFSGKNIATGGEHEVALLCYSSGTTGLAKGVMTTHQNLASAHATTQAVEMVLSPEAGDSALGVLPLYHIYGLVVAVLQPFARGVPIIILPRFIPELFLQTIQKYRITFSCVVPPIVVFLANDPIVDQFDLSSVRGTMSAAAPLGDGLVRKAVKRTNVKITQAYGLTETSPLTHVLDMDASLDHLGSVGKLLPNIQARIVDPDGDDVADGKPGELLIKGPNVMKGYWKNDKATIGTFTADGWFKTGDVAQVDRDGYYFIVDRLKELIKYKGFQVPPADLEALLLTHPKVADVAVIGVYLEEQATEVPKAFIVPVGGIDKIASPEAGDALSKEIVDWVATKVANHKKLRGGVSLIETIPKSAAGKILRRQLRVLSQADLAAGAQAKL